MRATFSFFCGCVAAMLLAGAPATASADADADWLARSTHPDVTAATRFDTPNDVSDWALDDSRRDAVSYDTDLKASGNGSLRFEILKTHGTNSGNWRYYLRDDRGTFNEGDEFYVQYRQYIPAYYATHKFAAANGWKSSIISRWDYSNTEHEVVIQNTGHRGYVQGYHQDGVASAITWSRGLTTACLSSDFVHQPAVDLGPQSVGTPCENDRARYGGLYSYTREHSDGTPDPLTAAFLYYPDEWITILQHIRVGSWGNYDSTLETWAARDGQDYVLLFSDDERRLGDEGIGFEALWLLPYNTRRVEDPSRQDTFTNYDEVIVSKSFIAAPGFPGGRGTARPSVTFSASPSVVELDGFVVLGWSTANASSCAATGDWSGDVDVIGSQSVGPIDSQSTFMLTCNGPGGTTTRTVTVRLATAEASDSSGGGVFTPVLLLIPLLRRRRRG